MAKALKLDDAVELEIEAMLDEQMTCVASDKLGKAIAFRSVQMVAILNFVKASSLKDYL